MKVLIERLGLLGLGVVLLATISGCGIHDVRVADDDKEQCIKQLEQVYRAIQAYRQDHKDLPNWLSDLVPKYLPSTNLLLCPITKRSGGVNDFEVLKDPSLPSSYLYEFSISPMGGIYNGGRIRMREFKRRQMGYVGGGIAMVRCHLHQPVLNLSFDGQIYESPLGWEDNFTNVVDVSTWSVQKLFPELASTGRTVGPPAGSLPPTELEGKPAPRFSLPLLAGGTFNLADLQGKNTLLLDFWASWCGPCRAAMPTLVEVAKEYAGRGVRYYAVNLREEPEVIERYLKGANLDIQVAMDKDGRVARTYGVTGIPTVVLINKEGLIEKVHMGATDNLKRELTDVLDDLLGGDLDKADSTGRHPAAFIPPRPANAPPEMVDLTSYYHAALTETWHPGNPGNDLSGMPRGSQELLGVQFDIRGVVQLNGGGMADMQGEAYPRRILGIKVGRKCTRLHFLHSTGWSVDDGTIVGRYVLRYGDGTREVLPIIYGNDVRDWWVGTDKTVELKNAEVVWQGLTSNGSEVRLYKRSWENPHPEREVVSIDFMSAMTRCAPFLLAVTAQP